MNTTELARNLQIADDNLDMTLKNSALYSQQEIEQAETAVSCASARLDLASACPF